MRVRGSNYNKDAYSYEKTIMAEISALKYLVAKKLGTFKEFLDQSNSTITVKDDIVEQGEIFN